MEYKTAEELLHYPLSDEEIVRYLNGQTKVLKYNEVNLYNDIEYLLHPYDNVVILMETKKNFGHWICIKKTGNMISFFDSYGDFPDKQKHHIDEKFLKDSGQGFNKICQLLDKASYRYTIEFSDRKLQDIDNETISTCGMWCCVFIRSGLTVDDFYKFLDSQDWDDSLDKLCVHLFKGNLIPRKRMRIN